MVLNTLANSIKLHDFFQKFTLNQFDVAGQPSLNFFVRMAIIFWQAGFSGNKIFPKKNYRCTEPFN